MGVWYLLISIFSDSAGNAIDRFNFKRNQINLHYLMYLVFLTMTASMAAYVIIAKQPLPSLSLTAIGLAIAIGSISFVGNYFDFLSLKSDDISLREPIIDFQHIPAALIGYLLFPAERHPIFLLAMAAGSLVVLWDIQRTKLRKSQRKGLRYLLIATAFYAMLPSLYKLTLEYINPAYTSLFRVGIVLILSVIFIPYKKSVRIYSRRTILGITSGLFYALGGITLLYSIEAFGVVVTTLFMLVGPALRYLAGAFILKEKIKRQELVSSTVLLLLVALSTILG